MSQSLIGWVMNGSSTGRALSDANPHITTVNSVKKVILKVGKKYRVVWNGNKIQWAYIEKLVNDGEGNSTVYFKIDGKVNASSGSQFKVILLEGGETELEL